MSIELHNRIEGILATALEDIEDVIKEAGVEYSEFMRGDHYVLQWIDETEDGQSYKVLVYQEMGEE